MARKRPAWVRWLKIGTVFGLIVLFAAIIVGSIFFFQYRQAAYSQFAKFESKAATLGSQPSEIVSADGKLLFQVTAEYRRPLDSLSEVPKLVQDAVVAAEDKRFWQHEGVDIVGLGRAAFVAAREGSATQGASTLTMQLAKRMVTGNERSVERKLQDIALATVIEERMTKEEILLLYLNQVYFGAGAYGIKAAADVYFGKTLDKLTISEAAFLARLVQRPPANPNRVLDRLIARRNLVLEIMREENMISEQQYKQALAERIRLAPRNTSTTARLRGAPYAVDHVLRFLEQDLGIGLDDLRKGGYRIETTIDYGLQRIAEKAVRDVVRRRGSVKTAAFVLIDRDGRILTEVGGVDYRRNQFNAVSNPSARRQPGSAFKPFVYAAALRAGVISMNGSVSNARIERVLPSGRMWRPQNSAGGAGGSTSLRRAFSMSINLPAIHTIEAVGPSEVVRTAQESFGFRSELDPGLALALGSSAVSPLELAEGYSTFMLRGDRVRPFIVNRVWGPDGQLVKRYEPQVFRQVFDPVVSDQIDELMRAVVTSGTGTRARGVPNARGKTGTTNDNRDAWFCGYTDGLVGIAWIANEQREGDRWVYKPMPGVFGGNTAVNIWSDVLEAAHKKYGVLQNEAPRPERAPEVTAPDEDFPIDNLGPDPAAEPPADNPAPDQDPASSPGLDEVPAAPATPTENPAPSRPVERPQPDRPRSEPPSDADTVEVEVCADSGMRASIYCPETVTRRFRRGSEPRRTCTTHGG